MCVCVVVLSKHLFEFPPTPEEKTHTTSKQDEQQQLVRISELPLYYSEFFFSI
jgi:hypothetical protein